MNAENMGSMCDPINIGPISPGIPTVANPLKTIRMSESIGKKYDSGKPQYGLIPPNALKQVAEVLTFGATKYGPDNWRHVDNAKERYFDALQRHVWEWKMGQQTDPETSKHHMAHAICCALFIAELEITKD